MYRRKSQCCPGFYENGEICSRKCIHTHASSLASGCMGVNPTARGRVRRAPCLSNLCASEVASRLQLKLELTAVLYPSQTFLLC